MSLESLDPAKITAASSVLMAIIWIVYLQLVLRQHRRASRPYLIIHHAHENGLNALCMFVNMSKEPVHLECVVAETQGKQGRRRFHVVDYDRLTSDDRNVQSRLRQGPIEPGGYLILGSFRDIMLGRRSESEEEGGDVPRAESALASVEKLSLSVAVVHGPSQSHIGASRLFVVEKKEEGIMIRAQSIHTEQLVHWRKRRRVQKWVEDRVNPKRRGIEETSDTEQKLRE